MTLPPMPEPFAHEAVWHARGDNDIGWAQWHDKEDPLPRAWDGEPPDVVTAVYTAEQTEQYGRLCAEAEREDCAQLAQETWEGSCNGCDGDSGYDFYGERSADAIRARGNT